MIERRARIRVRHELGLSYAVELVFVPLTRTDAHVVVVADCADAKAAVVRDALMGIVDALAEDGPTDEELAHDYELTTAQYEDPHGVLGTLAFSASGELLGEPARSPTELLRERAETSAAAVAEATKRLVETALLVMPEAAGEMPARYNPYPARPRSALNGRRHKLRGFNIARSSRALSLVAGDEGVAIEDGEGPVSRVRFDDCVALLRWPRGERALWSPDGFYVHVDPDDWRGGDDVVRLIDDRVARELVVPMERDVADRISAVDAAASASVKRGWSNDEELEALPDHLDEGEVILALAEARKGVRAGVLAVTDRRVLFLFLDKLVVAIRRAAIDSVDHGEGSMVQSNLLEISHGGERVVF